MEVIPLHLEIGDIYVVKEEIVISLQDITAISPIPELGNIFQWDSNMEFLCQLSENVLLVCS